MPRKPIGAEKRSEKINLVVTPTLNNKIKTLADSQGISLNEFIVALLEGAVKKNSAVIEKFEKARRAAIKSYVDIFAADENAE